ncbi:hypothetical protein Trydic_g12786 [Trypoxylus dichotomus]
MVYQCTDETVRAIPNATSRSTPSFGGGSCMVHGGNSLRGREELISGWQSSFRLACGESSHEFHRKFVRLTLQNGTDPTCCSSKATGITRCPSRKVEEFRPSTG